MLQTINDSCNKISFQFTELFLKPNAMIFHSLKTELSLIYVKLNDSIERERERERKRYNKCKKIENETMQPECVSHILSHLECKLYSPTHSSFIQTCFHGHILYFDCYISTKVKY